MRITRSQIILIVVIITLMPILVTGTKLFLMVTTPLAKNAGTPQEFTRIMQENGFNVRDFDPTTQMKYHLFDTNYSKISLIATNQKQPGVTYYFFTFNDQEDASKLSHKIAEIANAEPTIENTSDMDGTEHTKFFINDEQGAKFQYLDVSNTFHLLVTVDNTALYGVGPKIYTRSIDKMFKTLGYK